MEEKWKWHDGEGLLAGPADEARPRMLLEPLVPYTLRPTYLVGPFGSLKSYLALALAYALAEGRVVVPGVLPARIAPVLYMDWETDTATFQRRLGMLVRALQPRDPEAARRANQLYRRMFPSLALPGGAFEGDRVPGLLYRRMAKPLADPDNAYEVREFVRKRGVRLVVVDSAALAAGVEVDFAEAAVRLTESLNRIPAAALGIA